MYHSFFPFRVCRKRKRRRKRCCKLFAKKTKMLLVPFYVFSILSIFIYVIERDLDIRTAKKLVIDMLGGH